MVMLHVVRTLGQPAGDIRYTSSGADQFRAMERTALAAAIVVLIVSIAAGSVNLSPGQVLDILLSRLPGGGGAEVDANLASIVWGMRFPRAVLAFLAMALAAAMPALGKEDRPDGIGCKKRQQVGILAAGWHG